MFQSFANILSEARKYKLTLFLAHQYVEQLHEKIRSAIFGNIGTMISFCVGAIDAEHLAKGFHPVFNESDIINLPRYSMYIKLMIDDETCAPFSSFTSHLKGRTLSFKKEVVEFSREKYGTHC